MKVAQKETSDCPLPSVPTLSSGGKKRSTSLVRSSGKRLSMKRLRANTKPILLVRRKRYAERLFVRIYYSRLLFAHDLMDTGSIPRFKQVVSLRRELQVGPGSAWSAAVYHRELTIQELQFTFMCRSKRNDLLTGA